VPVIRIEGPYEIYFTSHDRGEPPHVHVDREKMAAKIWRICLPHQVIDSKRLVNRGSRKCHGVTADS
jgi:hypothetical protein